MISERIFGQNGENAFLCGILHDIGMIVEDQTAHDLFNHVCKAYAQDFGSIIDYEKEIIGTDHCEVGYLLAKEWKLPFEVQEGIKQHHSVLKEVSPSSITGTIQLSEYIVSKLDYIAMPGMEPTLSSPLSDHIRENVEEYKALVKDLPEEISRASELYGPQKE
jgi:HD-like signal output (HDOD) protein